MATTGIALVRHEAHENNILTPDGFERARLRGKVLGRTIQIQGAYSSPLPRAKSTAESMLLGAGVHMEIIEEPRLGDFKSDQRASPDSLSKLKAKAAQKYGDDSDSSLAKCLLDMPELHPLMLARAEEGAAALTEIAATNPNKFVIATSHGVARIEVVLRWLHGHRNAPEVLDIADKLIERGEVVLVMFDIDDKSGTVTFRESKKLDLPMD
jgi:broad specificity phosphatase PhoE